MKRTSISIGIVGLIAILGLLGAAGLAAGQDHQISGYVYEDGTYQSIDGAYVQVNGEGSWDTTTDGSGYYSIWVPEGSYSITVSASGYNNEDEWVTVSGSSETQDFYLLEVNGGGDGGGSGDGGGDISDQFNELGDQAMTYATICGSLIIILIVSILIMAIASVGIFVRLGKIKKELTGSQIRQQPRQHQRPYPAQQPQGSTTQAQPVNNQPPQSNVQPPQPSEETVPPEP